MSQEPQNKLKELQIKGFKSIRDMESPLLLSPLNVLIGANGSGKSNLISFFRMLSWTLGGSGGFQEFVNVKAGGGNALLFDGASVTHRVEARLVLETLQGENEYAFTLSHAAPDTLAFTKEQFRFSRRGFPAPNPQWTTPSPRFLDGSALPELGNSDKTATVLLNLLQSCRVFQFHNTSETARIRQRWDREDNYYLKEDAANLAPFLLRLREEEPAHYRRIVDTIRLAAPFLDDFHFNPDERSILLQWRERESDLLFGSHQASDGTLRVMALVSLLLQPERTLPKIIILDEPELGLHPAAIEMVAGLIAGVSQTVQVIVATQSTQLVDCFEAENIVVVERHHRASTFKRLSPERLEGWLEEYSLSELWEKNIIGGRPRL